jgi:hypothetical protein
MIRVQIVERHGVNLYRMLIDAMRSGDLRTFTVARRGRMITHRNPNYPGWMRWYHKAGVISCEVRSPRKPGTEWRLVSALVVRLADKFANRVHSISIQFPDAAIPSTRRKRRSRR